MNPEQQRVAIAEACGWKEIRAEVDWLPKELTGIFTWPHPTDAEKIKYFINRKPIPDYLNDLNAMHDAEKVLTPDTRPEYLCQLFDAATRGRSGLYPVDENYLSHHATADQRAEAFLRTIGKWKEAKP